MKVSTILRTDYHIVLETVYMVYGMEMVYIYGKYVK